jgi:hypothetical protein
MEQNNQNDIINFEASFEYHSYHAPLWRLAKSAWRYGRAMQWMDRMESLHEMQSD